MKTFLITGRGNLGEEYLLFYRGCLLDTGLLNGGSTVWLTLKKKDYKSEYLQLINLLLLHYAEEEHI